MSNPLLNECPPGVHALLLGLEMSPPSVVRFGRLASGLFGQVARGCGKCEGS
jgi:hypothetical protein